MVQKQVYFDPTEILAKCEALMLRNKAYEDQLEKVQAENRSLLVDLQNCREGYQVQMCLYLQVKDLAQVSALQMALDNEKAVKQDMEDRIRQR